MTGAKVERFRLKYDFVTSENKQVLLEDRIICHVDLYWNSPSVHLYWNSDKSLAHENQREFLTEYLHNSNTFLNVWKLILFNPFFLSTPLVERWLYQLHKSDCRKHQDWYWMNRSYDFQSNKEALRKQLKLLQVGYSIDMVQIYAISYCLCF